MDIVPPPSSNPAVQVPVNPVNPTPDTTAYSPTPALDALQNAYQKGLVQASDIQSLVKGGSDTAKGIAVNAADIQHAKLRQQVQPVQAQSDIAGAQRDTAQALADKGLIPATTAAKAAAAKAMATQSSLADLTAQAQIPETAFALKQATDNPSGTHSALVSIWKQVQPGVDLPTNKSGDVDYPAMVHALYGFYSNPQNQQNEPAAQSAPAANPHPGSRVPGPAGSTPAPAATGTALDGLPDSPASHILRDKITQYWNSMYYDTPEGKAVLAGINSKNAQDILTNPDGTSKPYWQVKADATNVADRWTGDSGKQAMADFNTSLAPQRTQLNQLTSMVNTPGMVGPAAGSGDWLGTKKAQVAAFLHLDPAKLNTQEQIDQAVKGQMKNIMGQVHNIRNQYEFNAVIGSIPSINDNTPVWNNWLQRAQKVIDDSAGVYKEHMPVESKNGMLDLAPAAAIPQAGAAAATGKSGAIPKFPGLSGVPVANTPEDAQKLPPNTWYNFNGQPALTPP